MIAATIFLVIFVLIGGVVMFLSKTIDHGEARFGPDGNVIRDPAPRPPGPAKPARRIETDKADDHE